MQPQRRKRLSAARAAGTALLVLGVAGCPPQRADLGVYTESDATTTEPPGAAETSNPTDTSSQDPEVGTSEATSTGATTGTSGAVDSTTTETPATTETGATTETSASESSGSTGEPAPSCEPEGPTPLVYSEVGLFPVPPKIDGKIDFNAKCTVIDVIEGVPGEGTPSRALLQCGATKATIFMYMAPAELPVLPLDHSLQFKFAYRDAPWWTTSWFTLVDTSSETPIIELAGFSGDTVTPPDLPDFYAPLGVEPLEGVCTGPIECPYPFERLGVRFTHGASELLLTDNTSGNFGDSDELRVLLGQAKRYVMEADDSNNELCPHYTDMMPVAFAGLVIGRDAAPMIDAGR